MANSSYVELGKSLCFHKSMMPKTAYLGLGYGGAWGFFRMFAKGLLGEENVGYRDTIEKIVVVPTYGRSPVREKPC